MAYTRINRQTTTATGVTSAQVTLTGVSTGNLLVIKTQTRLASGASGPPTITPTDSIGGTQWMAGSADTVDATFTRRSSIHLGILTASGNDTVTVTLNTAGDIILIVEEWHTSTAPWTDATALNDAIITGTGTSNAPAASGTTGSTSDILFGMVFTKNATPSITLSSPTVDDTGASPITLDSENLRDGHQILGAAGAVSFAATLGASVEWIALGIAVRDAGVVGTASKLGILRSPNRSALSGAAFFRQPRVAIQDVGGNTIATDNTTVVTATLVNIAGDTGTLVGTTSVTVVNGIATFTNLAVDLGTDTLNRKSGVFKLVYSATGLTSADSMSALGRWINVVPAVGDYPTSPTPVSQASAPPVTGTIYTVSTDAQLDTAIAAALPGDCIRVNPGTYTALHTLPWKTGWVTIEANVATIYSNRTRGARMTLLRLVGLNLPIFETQDSAPSIKSATPPSTPGGHWWFRGFEFRVKSGVTTNYGIVALGTDGPGGQVSLATMAKYFGFEQCYIHTPNDTTNCRRGITNNAAEVTVIDSTIIGMHEPGIECQAIGGWNTGGPFLCDNNEMSAAGEVMLIGGSDSGGPECQPSDFTVTRNHMYVPDNYKSTTAGGSAGTNTYGWSVKNIFEFKNVRRALVEGNVMHGMWSQNQDGHAIALKSVNQQGFAAWSGTSDVEFRYNILYNAGGGVDFGACPDSNNQTVSPWQPWPCHVLQRVYFHNNLFHDISPAGGFYASDSPAMITQQGGIIDLRVIHNSMLGPMSNGIGGTGAKALTMGPAYDGSTADDPMWRFWLKHNLMDFAVYAVIGDNTSAENAIDRYAPSTVQQTNGFYGTNALSGDYRITSGLYRASVSLNSDYSLAPGDAWKNAAGDGLDLGADITTINAKTASTVSGDWSGAVTLAPVGLALSAAVGTPTIPVASPTGHIHISNFIIV